MIPSPWQALSIVLAALCLGLGAGAVWYRHEAHAAQQQATALQQSINQAHAVAEAEATAQAAEADRLRAALSAAQSSIRTVTREVIRAIPASAACPALAGFVQYNPTSPDLPADPTGPSGPEPAGASVAPDAGPAARDIAATIGLAEQLRAEVITWREWYRQIPR